MYNQSLSAVSCVACYLDLLAALILLIILILLIRMLAPNLLLNTQLKTPTIRFPLTYISTKLNRDSGHYKHCGEGLQNCPLDYVPVINKIILAWTKCFR